MTKQTEALKLALGKVQEFKCLWWKVPSFGNKVNKATREAITNAHSPIFELENAIREALAEESLGTVLAQKNHYIKGIEDAIALLKTCGECSSEWLIDRLGDYKYKAEQTAQPQQEPVGKVVDCDSLGTPIVNWKTKSLAFGTKLYTSPPASKPWIRLTDNEIDECAGTDFGGVWLFDTAYAIEAKLKEKNI